MIEWISVKDKLPSTDVEFTEFIIFEVLNKKVQQDYFNSRDRDWSHYGKYVTHWMPFPNPPEKK